MIIEAPASKFRKSNLKIYIIASLLAAVIFGYDGYLSKYKWSMRYSFYEEHVLKNNNKPDDTMVWNQKWLPIICGGTAVLFGAYLFVIRNRKIMADENELVIDGKKRIPYDAIEKVDKTYFVSKRYFTVTHKDSSGKEAEIKLSDRKYDNLEAVLDKLVEKMS